MEPLLRHGFWCTEESEQSSNWREMRNLLDALKIEVEQARLVGRELWLATDNSTTASAFFKGTSSSRSLHEMVTELRELSLKGKFTLHIFHIAGSKMIQIGIDGLSRGELHADALERTPISAAPLHLSPIERYPVLVGWLKELIGAHLLIATPHDWFYAAQQGGQHGTEPLTSETWIWDLPPAAAIHALEELGSGRLKRHEMLRGVVLVPCLLQNEWFWRFARIVDCYLIIPAGAIPAWPESMHEGLVVGFYFPLLRFKPWCWKRIPFVVQLCIKMSKMYRTGDSSAGDILRQFWASSLRVASMPKRVVQRVLQEPTGHQFLNLSRDRQSRGRAHRAWRGE
jgi:hypothetical protein